MAKKNNFPINYETFESAAENKNIKIMKWLKKYNYSCNVVSTYKHAIKSENFKNIKWLKKNYPPINYSVGLRRYRMEITDLKMINWLKKHMDNLYF